MKTYLLNGGLPDLPGVFCWQSGQIYEENLLTRELERKQILTVRAIPVSSPPPKCGILDPK